MSMKNITLSIFVLAVFSTGYAQQTGLKGRVVEKSNTNNAVQGAQVRLINANKSQTTDWDGRFLIEGPAASVLSNKRIFEKISLHNGVLSFAVSGDQQEIKIDIFDIKGQKVGSMQEILTEGFHSKKILSDNLPLAMYFVKFKSGKEVSTFKINNLANQTSAFSGKGASFENSAMENTAAAAVDTLEVSKSGFQTLKVAVNSYVADLGNILLQSNASNDEGLPPVVNGRNAKTTRYWDCCKPHCGWHSNMRMCDINGNTISDKNAKSSCEGGPAFQCLDYSPFAVNSKISYGWAAFNNSGTQCGDCFQLDLQGSLSGKQMIVQVINIGDGGTDAFDLLIPGGGVGQFNGCSRQWNNAPLGVQYGGFRSTCGANRDCIYNMCNQAFGNKPDLMKGCNWYLDWFNMASNPNVVYMKVPCPQKIKDISKIGN